MARSSVLEIKRTMNKHSFMAREDEERIGDLAPPHHHGRLVSE